MPLMANNDSRTVRRRLKALRLLDWPTTGQFLGALSALGILLFILGAINLWFLLHSDANTWLHLANSVLLLGGVMTALVYFPYCPA